MSTAEVGPGPITRASSRTSSRNLVRQISKPYMRRQSSQGSGSSRREGEEGTGLTKYAGDISLSFDKGMGAERDSMAAAGVCAAANALPELSENTRQRAKSNILSLGALQRGRKKSAPGDGDENIPVVEEENGGGELTLRSISTFGRALSSFRQGKAAGPREIDLWKPDVDTLLGVTFEVPADEAHKGVVVAEIHAGYLMARLKKLRVGDVVHAINGQPVATPLEGATLLRDAKGVIQLVVSRVNAKPKDAEREPWDEVKQGGGRARSLLPISTSRGPKQKREEDTEEHDPAANSNTTVVVSCSQLILESKKIVGETAGLDDQLDALYTQLKAKEVRSQAALHQLIGLVGQTTVEQAGLVIANAHQGSLPEGWVEYYDRETSRCYYYNVHSKVTTWYKPRKDSPPPSPYAAGGKQGVAENTTSTGHGVAGAIAAMHSKRKMVETVQVECSSTPRKGVRGLQSVSL